MATTTDRMIAVLEARFNQYERALSRAQGNTNRTFTAIERRGRQLEQRLSRIGSGVNVRGILGPLAAGASLRGAQQLVDAATRTQNALRVAGLEGEELTRVYERLFESAQRNAAPVEALVTLYGRMALAQKELNATGEELLQFADLVAMSLRASGQSAAEAQGALLQLGQALGSGKVQAEEYNSLIDGARPLLQAVAAGLEEAGGSVARLTALVKAGEVSSEAFFRAGQAGADVLRDQLAGAELTVSQAFVRLRNVLEDTAGELNEGSGATARMAEALEDLGNWIRDTDFAPLINGVMDFGSAITGVIGKIQDMAREAGKAVGADAVGTYLRGTRAAMIDQRTIESRVAGAFGDSGPSDKGPRTVIDVPAPPKVTLADYPVVGSGSGGGRDRAAAAAEREANAVRDLISELEEELRLVGATSAQKQVAATLRRVNVDATSAEGQQIASLIQTIEAETEALERNKEAQEARAESIDYLFGLGEDALSAIVDGSVKAEDAIKRLAVQLALAAAQAALLGTGPLAGFLGGGSGGGIGGFLGGLLGGGRVDSWAGLRSFDGGGSTGWASRSGGVDGKGGFPALLHPRETVIDHTKPMAGGGSVAIGGNTYQITSSGDPQQIVRAIEQYDRGRMARLARDLPQINRRGAMR